MKKKISLVMSMFFLGITMNVSAQELSYGVKAGLNVSTITDNEDWGENVPLARVGVSLGFMAEYKLSDAMAISTDFIFSMQGNRWKYTDSDIFMDSGYSYENTYKDVQSLWYLNIPILFNYYITDKLAIKAGLQPGFCLSAKYKYSEGFSDSDGENYYYSGSDNMKSYIKTIDFSIPIGISYEVTDNIIIDARYSIGVANIYKSQYYGDAYTMRNNVFALTVGYKL